MSTIHNIPQSPGFMHSVSDVNVVNTTPSYSFRSTSIYLPASPSSGDTYTGLAGTPFRSVRTESNPYSEFPGFPGFDDQNEIGTLPDPPDSPVGDPLILIIFATVFLAYGYFRRKAELRKRSFLRK